MSVRICSPYGCSSSFHATGRGCAVGARCDTSIPGASTSALPPRSRKPRSRASGAAGTVSGVPASTSAVTSGAGWVESVRSRRRTSYDLASSDSSSLKVMPAPWPRPSPARRPASSPG